jgi:hypothetical protein
MRYTCVFAIERSNEAPASFVNHLSDAPVGGYVLQKSF